MQGTGAYWPPSSVSASDTLAITGANASAIAVADPQQLFPDAILTQTNIGGTVADIDEDPDSADANWMLGGPNLIPAASSGFETGVGAWATLDSCTVTQSSAQAHSGTYSMALTRTTSGSGAMSARPGPYTLLPVTPGAAYKIRAWTRAATTPRAAKVWLEWYDSGGAAYGSGDNFWTGANSTSAWQLLEGSLTAPAGSAYARLAVQVDGPPADGEVHYFDDVYLGLVAVVLRVSFPTPTANLKAGFPQEFRVRVRPGT